MKFCAKWDMQRIINPSTTLRRTTTSEVPTMTIKAKEVLKNKFWIVEENGFKVGTLSAPEECYTYSSQGTQVSRDFNQLKKHLGKISWTTADDKTASNMKYMDIPISCEPIQSQCMM